MTLTINPRPPFPTLVDSSMRAAFVACPHKFFLEYLNGFVLSGTPTDLHAGAAFAKGAEAARRLYYGGQASSANISPDDALIYGLGEFCKAWGSFEDPVDSNKTFWRMFGALVHYFDAWPLEKDYFTPILTAKGPAVEFTFALPVEGTAHPDTGEPILYGGRFDVLGTMNGLCLVEDDKTTKQLGAQWARQWDLKGQFLGYVWGARKHGYDCQGALVRGISILKEDYGTAQTIVMFTKKMLERWEDQLRRDLNRMVTVWKSGHWDRVFDSACSAYRGCPFVRLCSSEDPELWLEPDFQHRVYDPLNVREKLSEGA